MSGAQGVGGGMACKVQISLGGPGRRRGGRGRVKGCRCECGPGSQSAGPRCGASAGVGPTVRRAGSVARIIETEDSSAAFMTARSAVARRHEARDRWEGGDAGVVEVERECARQ